MKKFVSINYLFVFFSVLVFVLNPYTIYGKPGVIFAGFFAVYALANKINKTFFQDLLVPAFWLMLIAIFGALSSAANGIFQLSHPLALVSFISIILGAKGLFLYCKKINLSVDDLLLIIFLTIVLNSLIVLLELQFDSIRQTIENYLDPLSNGSINYAEGFRLRGIASSGGAGLSISIPAALIIGLYLFDKNKLNIIVFLIFIIILIVSVTVIGRSGLVLLAIPVISYLGFLLFKKNGFYSLIKTFVFVLIFGLLIAPLLYGLTAQFLTDRFGEMFVRYAFGFLFDGQAGIKEEGTVGTVAGFLAVLPANFPQALTGYGFYGGSDFYPWTDSGLSRTFLSVGFPLGFIFYILLMRLYLLPFYRNKFLIGSFICLLAVAELKEPLLFSGMGFRIFMLILVNLYCENIEDKKIGRGNKSDVRIIGN